MRFRSASRFAPLLALVALLAFTGCDTNNGGSVTLRNVAGNYRFTELRFESQGIVPANALTRLDSAGTLVRIAVDGRTFFFLEGDTGPLTVEATTSISGGRVTIQAPANDANTLALYLIPERISLPYNEERLSIEGTQDATINLHRFDPQRYGPSLTAVQGTLRVRLDRD